ncbi:3-hydroxybutyrate oligomer hydrolase family protein [Roseateles koreensis]|uniref:3-hydroxybutyrate oligomer hydrolase family protein n=1 Tax=Roseateles koreensis TaxID=2987526 RepID=A0ABT5KPC9_9BURK|nr:3-hydroxybutyrate oligomer hydrolase family protein [Roseateles koreensis]MDC8784766.1 3-hydroxybutyrate oligomer hydrolase family protein [Roseateles koreensis]
MNTMRWMTVTAVAGLCACGGDGVKDPLVVNTKPDFVVGLKTSSYDGVSDDLLTAGLGKSGLASASLAAYADPLNPTAAELRRAAIYTNYRAIVDVAPNGGYGSLFGPNVTSDGTVGSGEGMVAGTETVAYSDDGTGQRNVTLMVQVPSTFNPSLPCIITAASSGSRSIYGAISTGEWGLKKGCAVAYTDKGTHSAGHDLATDTVAVLDGTRSTAAAAGTAASFRAKLSAAELSSFNATTPNRLAFKHAHSQRNPEKDWGLFTLQAVQLAFYVLNERYGQDMGDGRKWMTITPANTVVIASSLSNGGGAAVAAAELDTAGLIDGVAVSEPAVALPPNLGVTVQRGGSTPLSFGKPLYDYITQANLLQNCASLATAAAGSPGAVAFYASYKAKRCQSLANKGIISGATTLDQANAALQKLHDSGWEAESDVLHASLGDYEVPEAVSVTYANAYARASVKDKLCGYGFAATTAVGLPAAIAPAALADMFAKGNGVPPSAGVNVINENSVGVPVRNVFSTSPSSGTTDINADGAECLRKLLTGTDTTSLAVQAGIAETYRNGNLHGRPAVIVHGRNDALLPVNHTSRPYTALNKKVEGAASNLSYIEVTNAQHFDTFIDNAFLPGYDSRYIPLHIYLNRALDAVYDKLRSGKALPPSQVVRTLPRGGTAGAAPALGALNVPAIAAAPAAGDLITMSGTTLSVPD